MRSPCSLEAVWIPRVELGQCGGGADAELPARRFACGFMIPFPCASSASSPEGYGGETGRGGCGIGARIRARSKLFRCGSAA